VFVGMPLKFCIMLLASIVYSGSNSECEEKFRLAIMYGWTRSSSFMKMLILSVAVDPLIAAAV